MMAQSLAQTDSLPQGLSARLNWRPPGLRALESLLPTITGPSQRLLRREARLATWYHQFTRRVSPWPESSPLELGLAEQTRGQRQPESNPRKAYDKVRLAPSVGDPSPVIQPVPTTSATPRVESANHSALRLAMLPATQTTAKTSTRTEVSPNHLVQPIPRGLETLLPPAAENAAAFQPRMVLRASASTHVAVRGGYPASMLALPGDGAEEEMRAEPALSGVKRPAASPPAQQAADLSSQGAEAGAIQRFIETTRLPEPFPGLKLRLIVPENTVADGEQAIGASEKSQRAAHSPASSTPSLSTGPGQAPPLDINAIADKVYQTLARRQQRERDRRGLY